MHQLVPSYLPPANRSMLGPRDDSDTEIMGKFCKAVDSIMDYIAKVTPIIIKIVGLGV